MVEPIDPKLMEALIKLEIPIKSKLPNGKSNPEYNSQYRDRNPDKPRNEYKRQLSRAKRKENKAKALEYLGGKCVGCGETENLEFDHIDPYSKTKKVTRDFGTASWKSLKEELDKCQLLCKDCHREKTIEERRSLVEHGTITMYGKYKCRCESCREASSDYLSSWKAKRNASK